MGTTSLEVMHMRMSLWGIRLWIAMITPFRMNGFIDWPGMKKLIRFLQSQGIQGIVAVGTTGESPTLSRKEHIAVIRKTALLCANRDCRVLAGTGSNCTAEAIALSEAAVAVGADGLLVVDPYYNKPASRLIRDKYYEPIARAVPSYPIVPYVIPGRTGGSGLLPADLAILANRHQNIAGVKDATGSYDRMRETRTFCGKDFPILCGDDGMTFDAMRKAGIRGYGAISVIGNFVPAALGKMIDAAAKGDWAEAERIDILLRPFSDLVTIRIESTRVLPNHTVVPVRVTDIYPNPVGCKIAMNILGMPAGICRAPLGRMPAMGVEQVRRALLQIWEQDQSVLQPIGDFFKVDIAKQLNDFGLMWSLAHHG